MKQRVVSALLIALLQCLRELGSQLLWIDVSNPRYFVDFAKQNDRNSNRNSP